MVLPPDPVSHWIFAQSRFALGPLKAFFDAVFTLGHAGELLQRRVGSGVREIIIVFISPVRLLFTGDEQHFFWSRAAGRCAGLNAASNDLGHEF